MLSKRDYERILAGIWVEVDSQYEESWPWSGTIEIIGRDHSGAITEHATFKNLIMDAGRNMLRDALGGVLTSSDAQIHYVALGNSSTTPATSQTQLVSEQFRKAVTATSVPGTGARLTTVYIAPGEALGTSFTINEIGWFAGASASLTANTGVMVARVLYSRSKAATESLQINRTDQF